MFHFDLVLCSIVARKSHIWFWPPVVILRNSFGFCSIFLSLDICIAELMMICVTLELLLFVLRIALASLLPDLLKLKSTS